MHAHGREAAVGLADARHRPEKTQLYRLVEQHYPGGTFGLRRALHIGGMDRIAGEIRRLDPRLRP